MLKRLTVTILLTCLLPVTMATAESLSVKEEWSTKAELKEPESVVYDILRRSIYVSNINGAPDLADGNGFISLIANDGTIEKLKWFDGLNAPKGMAIFGNNLYVADINELLVIDLKTTQVTKRFSLEGKHFLNDIAVSKEGMIFVTDTATDSIYRFYNGKFEAWLTDKRLNHPNGIYIDNQNIIIGGWGKPTEGWKTDIPGHLLLISLKDKSIKNFGTGKPIGNLDGIAKLDNSTFLVTDWYQGKLIKASTNGEVKTLLDLAQGSADIYYRRSQKLLLIPHMLEGRLVAYSVKK
jgi:DNA-binding beta-propeller fold protein YncE